MSWLFSRVLVEEYLGENCSDGEQCAPLKMSPMPPLFLPSDKMTGFSRLSRYGMTFGTLTDDLGAGVLTWFLAGFPARTLAPQDEEPESLENEADSGWKWRESLVKYDPVMRSWKTRQCSLFEDSEWFSETWPRWGLMQDGECWELPMSERPTFERGSGLLPTPRTQMSRPCKQRRLKGGHKSNLEEVLAIIEGVDGGTVNPNYAEWLMGGR